MLTSVAFRPIRLKSTPSQSVVCPPTVRLPSIVLFLIDQGISEPPPASLTFPLTVSPFRRTAAALMAVTFPLMVMVECPSGSTAHSCAELPVYDGGWQPRPTSEPAAPVTLRPTVMVDGALCASSLAPSAMFTLPTTLITASAGTLQAPLIVMLA